MDYSSKSVLFDWELVPLLKWVPATNSGKKTGCDQICVGFVIAQYPQDHV